MIPKILLLVNSDPEGKGIGELFLSEIGKVYPNRCLVRYSTLQIKQSAGESNWFSFRSIKRYLYASRWPILSSFNQWFFSLTIANKMANEVSLIIKEEGVDVVWAVLSSGPIITLVDRLMKQSEVPVVSTVLDDPEYFTKNQHVDPITWRSIHNQFANVLRQSRKVSVIGESMQVIYRKRYGVESVIMRHGVEESYFKTWHEFKPSKQIIRIGFSGSLYAKKEWNALLGMLEKYSGRIGGKDIRVSFIGKLPRTGVRNSRYVDYLGHMSFDAALNALNESDIAYLPYWFDKRHSVAVQTSFPGKLSTYAACGLPVLYHGPQNSSVTPFLINYPFGISCHSLNEEPLYEAILKLTGDNDFQCQASAARDQAIKNELSSGVMLSRFKELVGWGE